MMTILSLLSECVVVVWVYLYQGGGGVTILGIALYLARLCVTMCCVWGVQRICTQWRQQKNIISNVYSVSQVGLYYVTML